MPFSSDFYTLLSTHFQQIATAVEAPPLITPADWPLDSPERHLLDQLQTAVTAQQTHHQQQTTLLHISQTLAAALELKPSLILDQLGRLLDYTHAVAFALDELTLTTLAVRGSPELETAVPFRIRLNPSETLTPLLQKHQPQRIANVASNDPAAHALRAILSNDAARLLIGIGSWMWVPMAVPGQLIGVIGIAHRHPNQFTQHHAQLALAVADQAAIALINAQLYQEAQTLATLQERQRLAQNLHDAVNQSLFSASLIAEVLPRLWIRDPQEGQRSLEDLRRLTRGAMAEMRGLLAELRPLILTDTDLDDLLRQLGNALTGRTNIPVTVTVAGQGTLPAEVQVMFYRLCQEGLNNIAKHARASQVTMHLHYAAAGVALHIRDNGRGFDPQNIPSGHFGLGIMRERAEAVGAVVSIISQPSQGTEIVVRWAKRAKEANL